MAHHRLQRQFSSIPVHTCGTRRYAWLPVFARRELLRRALVVRVRATQGGSVALTGLTVAISHFGASQIDGHVRHTSRNPRRNNAFAVGSASELLWQHGIIGLRRTLDHSHVILTRTTCLVQTLRTFSLPSSFHLVRPKLGQRKSGR